jgi:putative tryptophan/tyrosine transport system substrate-binding protein
LPTAAAFRQGLREIGFVEGRNVEVLYRAAEFRYDRAPELAADLVRRGVNVIVAVGGPASALAAKSATSRIPIVFANGRDPVAVGLVASLNRPGGNITGVSFLMVALTAKRLELLHETVPAAVEVGYLVNLTLPDVEAELKEAKIAADMLGLRLVTQKASTPTEIETAFATFPRLRVGAVLVDTEPLFVLNGDQIAGLAARYALPAIYSVRENAEAGGLMSYGASLSDAFRLTGIYAGRILKGEKPADLPVQQSTKVEFIINMKTARALGLTFPLALLARADEVIE